MKRIEHRTVSQDVSSKLSLIWVSWSMKLILAVNSPLCGVDIGLLTKGRKKL
jgi:hypothetical protein